MKINSFLASRAAPALAFAAILLSLGGCATVQNPSPLDPWEGMNRATTRFNEGVDAVVLKPVATVYQKNLPPLVRRGVGNFFGNLGDVWSFVNSALQFKLQDAADNFARVQTNTLWGVFGIFDVASDLNIERHREDFGQTLGRWGVGAGPYLVLPLLGPSTLRDTAALPIDWKGDLVRRIDPVATRNIASALRAVHLRASLLRATNVLDEAALDKYSFTRDAHLQRRRAEIYELDDPRREVPPPLPDEGIQPQLTPAPAGSGLPARQPPPAPAR
ncbi:MAG: lipoprotein precursor-like protein [Ramlibacter sp.]|nr:lipoprotein precursor-like protein [Ramlibacter sp.]